MKERLNVLNFKYNVVSVFFVFILIISILAPLSGNDWVNYASGKGGLLEGFRNLTFENGGLLSDALAKVFTNSKGMFDILFAGLFTFTLYNLYPLFGKIDNKYHFALIPILLLMVGVETFAYNYISVTGTVCYTFPALAIINYYLYLYRIGSNKFRIIDVFVLLLIMTYVSVSTIHLAIAFLVSNILFYAYKCIDNKPFPKWYVVILLIQIVITISALFYVDKAMLFSSFSPILGNIPKFIDGTFSKNILLIILGTVPINIFINEKLKDFSYKRVILVLFTLVPILSLLYNFFNYSPVNLNLVINKYSGVFATENWYFIFYYIIYFVLYALTIISYIKREKSRNYILLFLIAGLITNLFVIVSPDYNNGSNILFVITFIISLAVLYKEMNIKIWNKVYIVLLILLPIYYLSIFSMCKYIDVTRHEYIDRQIATGKNNIVVKSNPFFLVYRYNPVTIFQKRDFKMYIDVPSDTKLEVKYFGVFKRIEDQVKNEKK